MLFAKNIRFLRKAAGIVEKGSPFSQDEMAHRLSVSKRTMIHWESGAVPHKSNIEKIITVFTKIFGLKITYEELLHQNIAGKIDLVPRSEFERGLSPGQRKILRSMFLSATGLNETQLLRVIEYIENMKSE